MPRRSESEKAPKIGVQATASVTASFLSGAMMSLSTIAVPVFFDTDTTDAKFLVRQWARLYHYGHIYMPAVAVAATGLYAYTALCQWRVSASAAARDDRKRKRHWLIYAVAGVSTISIVPFTWVFMDPTNYTLFRLDALPPPPPAQQDSAAAASSSSSSVVLVEMTSVRQLLVKWAWLHVVRSLFPLAGSILGLVGVLQELGL